MPTKTTPIEGKVWEDGGAFFMARVTGRDAANITQATISSITYKVFDIKDLPGSEKTSGTLTVSDVVFNTLQTDNRWSKDSTGYNFRHEMPASTFADGDRFYQVEYLFTPSTGEKFYLVFKIEAKETFTS